ncbi:hypothetical protein GCM10022408_12940 [Hymenobacter fastidiosus]|uniref:Uncharacterized protein n=1 Tax=Hymenobacter fastidiosus TaxID=486264 RepID=A0ABP7RVJ5_9BACT
MLPFLYRPLIGALLLALPAAARAQAPDSAQTETSARSDYAPGEVVTPTGQRVKAYFPNSVNGFEKTIAFYYSHPEVRPFPPAKLISVDKIHTMTVRGNHFETLTRNGKSLHVLAARLVDGPVELFNFAEEKGVPIPIPIPGAMLLPIASIPYTKNHWYLRRNGELTEVKRGQFVEQLRGYLQDQPALVEKVQQHTKYYQYPDMVHIITEYNQHVAAKP